MLPMTGSMASLTDPLVRQRYYEVLSMLATAFPDRVRVVDLAGWVASQADPPAREDGLHWTRASARELADRYLAPIIVGAAVQ